MEEIQKIWEKVSTKELKGAANSESKTLRLKNIQNVTQQSTLSMSVMNTLNQRHSLVGKLCLYMRHSTFSATGSRNLNEEIIPQSWHKCCKESRPVTITLLPSSGDNRTEVLAAPRGPGPLVCHPKFREIVWCQAVKGLKSKHEGTLYRILCLSGSQRSLLRTGLIGSCFQQPDPTPGAMFWTRCILLSTATGIPHSSTFPQSIQDVTEAWTSFSVASCVKLDLMSYDGKAIAERYMCFWHVYPH